MICLNTTKPRHFHSTKAHMNIDCLRYNLLEIESSIKAFAGHDIYNSDGWTSSPGKREEIYSLLEKRRRILNDLFFPSKENIHRFKAVNERLYSLTVQLHNRVKTLEEKRSLVMDCPEFDDDYEVYGTLRYCFNSEESVLNLNDNGDYGSDFMLMIKLIADFSYGTVNENIEYFRGSSTIIDDGQSWNEDPFAGRKEFDSIIICHAVHQLTNHQLYSIPDLIRLNDFWAEVHFIIHSITEQDGTRYIPIKLRKNKTNHDSQRTIPIASFQ